MKLNPEQLAKACSKAMHANDLAAQMLAMDIIHSAPGSAELQMTVRQDMLNGHAICHGGIIYSLADTAFAHACNSYNKVTVAAGCSIEYAAPAHEGDRLRAVAQERHRRGRTGVYDITVYNQDNKILALFRGKSHQIHGELVDEDGQPLNKGDNP